jgi:hypothetical protein
VRLIIAGSRTINLSEEQVSQYVKEWEEKHGHTVTTIVTGMASGVDSAAYYWARNKGKIIDAHPADWQTYGKSAGIRRNRVMAENADGLLLVWDGTSKGSANMLRNARSLKLLIHEIRTGYDAGDAEQKRPPRKQL